MEFYFAAGFADNITDYNCSIDGKTHEDWEIAGTVNKSVGIIFMTFGIIVEICYALVILIMLRPEIIKLSCYKIMILLCIYDMLATSEASIMSGYFFYIGSVYCRYEDWNYITGTFANALWCGACLTAFILVFNRVLELWKPHLMEMLLPYTLQAICFSTIEYFQFFGGKRILFWFSLPILYSIYFIMYPCPIIFNSNIRSWFFDPFIRENESYKFHNYSHLINNFSICLLTPMLYIFLCYILLTKYRSSNHKMSWKQISTIIQSCVICSANLAAGMIFVYMNFFPTPFILIFIGQMMWMLGHAVPVFVYITLNRTIQRELFRMFCRRRNVIGSTHESGTRNTNTQGSAALYEI